jgi:hypothetical protein
MSDMLGSVLTALVGGLLAIAGALSAHWFQNRATLRTRMSQVIAERKVSANADAYKFLKMIEGHLAERADAQALALMVGRADWLFANRLYLPASFTETWTALQATLRWLSERPADPTHDIDDVHRLRLQALRYVKQAMRAIYHDMDFEDDGHDVKTPA